MMKNNLKLEPTMGTFDLQCIVPRTDKRILDSLNKLCSSGRYICTKKGYEFRKRDGSMIVTYWVEWRWSRTLVKIKNIDLALLTGDQSKLALADLSDEKLKNAEENLLRELDDFGLLRYRCQWSLSGITFVQDFCTKEPVSVFMKSLKYYTEYMDYYEKIDASLKKEIRAMSDDKIYFGNGKFCVQNKERELERLS